MLAKTATTMTHKLLVCAGFAVSLALGAPRDAAAMGFGNPAPVVGSLSASPSPIPAASTATIGCGATDDSSVNRLTVSVSGGLLPNGTTTQDFSITPGASVSGTMAWSTPPAGSYTITCTATDGYLQTGATTIPAAVVTIAQVVIDSMNGPTGPVLAGSSVPFTVVAHDLGGGALAYAWAASAGVLASSGATATWTAPASGGTAIVMVTATNTAGNSAAQTMQVQVTLALAEGSVGPKIPSPRRLAVAPGGRLYAADARGGLWMMNARGELMGRARLGDGDRVVAVAAGDVEAFASTTDGRILRIDPATGRAAGQIDLRVAHGPVGMALDTRNNLLWLADKAAGRLRALRPGDGRLVFDIDRANGAPLRAPVDVAVDAAGGLVWVLLEAGEATSSGQLAHAFDAATGAWVRSAVTSGGAAGQVFRGGGLSVDAAGRVYVSDFFNGNVQVMERTGLASGKLGSYGAGEGQLKLPAGAAILANGDLVVANGDNERLERFGSGAALASCPGDGDCDGLPDDWEARHGLDPNDPADALLDGDGDGLTNLQEHALGTDPTKKDTDGDGVSDGQEVSGGSDPLVADRKPAFAASAPVPQGPGIVRISSAVQGLGGCTAAWSQVGGPAVTLRGGASFTPSFVARQAGSYALQGVASCNGVASDPVVVQAVVLEVAPRADAGRVQVAAPGDTVELDGTSSSDANGGAPALAWDQVAGRPVAGASARGSLLFRAREPGALTFQLTAADGAGLASAATVPVVVLSRDGRAPTAAAVTPVQAQAGVAVTLDASGSFRRYDDAAFRWRQVEGAPVALSGASGAKPSFVPPAAGRYAFEVVVGNEKVQSLPARVEVLAAAAGQALPAAAAQLLGTPRLGEPVDLSGAASVPGGGGALQYRWTQVAGPAAGLTSADRAVATVVPFAPGAYAFDLTVVEGLAESTPARAAFAVAPAGGMPVAAARVKAGGKKVVLDGRASRNALRWRWTQVAGPWVALERSGGVASFEPRTGGSYAFELEVDDGAARSAPLRVAVTVAGHDVDDEEGEGE